MDRIAGGRLSSRAGTALVAAIVLATVLIALPVSAPYHYLPYDHEHGDVDTVGHDPADGDSASQGEESGANSSGETDVQGSGSMSSGTVLPLILGLALVSGIGVGGVMWWRQR